MPTITTDRNAFHYKDYRANDHTPTLLIHGAGGMYLDWAIETRRSPILNAIALDLPAHGESGVGQGRASVRDYADDIVSLLDALDIPQANIIGHSMGGAIAQTLALHYPERVACLGLVSTGARLAVNPAIIEGIVTNTRATAEMVLKWMWAKGTPEEILATGLERLLNMPAQIIHDDYVACDMFDLRDSAAQIRHDTLVLCGTADKMTPLALSTFLVETLPNAALHTFEGAGHMLPLERAQEVTETLENWLSR